MHFAMFVIDFVYTPVNLYDAGLLALRLEGCYDIADH